MWRILHGHGFFLLVVSDSPLNLRRGFRALPKISAVFISLEQYVRVLSPEIACLSPEISWLFFKAGRRSVLALPADRCTALGNIGQVWQGGAPPG